MQFTHSLEAPDFNPRAYKVKNQFHAFTFKYIQLVPLHPGAAQFPRANRHKSPGAAESAAAASESSAPSANAAAFTSRG
jgi:hypothetical protein